MHRIAYTANESCKCSAREQCTGLPGPIVTSKETPRTAFLSERSARMDISRFIVSTRGTRFPRKLDAIAHRLRLIDRAARSPHPSSYHIPLMLGPSTSPNRLLPPNLISNPHGFDP